MPQDLLYNPIYSASWGQHMPWRAMHFCQPCHAIYSNIWCMHNASTSNMHNFCYTTPNEMIQEANLLTKTYSSCPYAHQCEGSWSQQGHHTSVTPCTHMYQMNHLWTTMVPQLITTYSSHLNTHNTFTQHISIVSKASSLSSLHDMRCMPSHIRCSGAPHGVTHHLWTTHEPLWFLIDSQTQTASNTPLITPAHVATDSS